MSAFFSLSWMANAASKFVAFLLGINLSTSTPYYFFCVRERGLRLSVRQFRLILLINSVNASYESYCYGGGYDIIGSSSISNDKKSGTKLSLSNVSTI
jgi:hypothetical protein